MKPFRLHKPLKSKGHLFKMKWFSMQMCCLLVEAAQSQEIWEVKEQKMDQNMNFNLFVTVLWFIKLQLIGWVLELMKDDEGLACDWNKCPEECSR